jgi:hypothetical protein
VGGYAARESEIGSVGGTVGGKKRLSLAIKIILTATTTILQYNSKEQGEKSTKVYRSSAFKQ